VPWKWRALGGPRDAIVFVELFGAGQIVVRPPIERLDDEQAEWAEKAIAELLGEWTEHERLEVKREADRPERGARRRLLVMAPIPKPISEMTPDELRAFSGKVAEAMRLRYDADPAECGHESGHER
jgi:hypothetical protein